MTEIQIEPSMNRRMIRDRKMKRYIKQLEHWLIILGFSNIVFLVLTIMLIAR